MFFHGSHSEQIGLSECEKMYGLAWTKHERAYGRVSSRETSRRLVRNFIFNMSCKISPLRDATSVRNKNGEIESSRLDDDYSISGEVFEGKSESSRDRRFDIFARIRRR